MTLTDFLLARIAEDEAKARRLQRDMSPKFNQRAPRLFAECEAKRRIVADLGRYERSGASEVEGAKRGLRMAVRALAAVYSDHPDYRAEWRA